ncbi:MAG: GntR family transcriptional regulator [Rhodobacteraceae bacterium]|nr:GntR family transcriptional regulator [Paracoccaceae bacterium]
MPAKPKVEDEYSRLYKMIVTGKIMPNERIVEMDYAQMFNCNRANIRRALARLEQDGLVVIEPFKGARVRLVTPEEAVETYEVRGALETLLVSQAAKLATEADKAILREILNKLYEARDNGDPMRVGTIGRQIREELWRISSHKTALKFLTQINSQLIRSSYRSVMMPGRADAIAQQLTEVVDHVSDGDAEKASEAMRQYHASAREALVAALQVKDYVF